MINLDKYLLIIFLFYLLNIYLNIVKTLFFARVNKLFKKGTVSDVKIFWECLWYLSKVISPNPDVGTVWTCIMSCYFIIMLVGVVIKCKLPQSFVFWELKNLFGVARELNGKAPHHPSPHADEKVA